MCFIFGVIDLSLHKLFPNFWNIPINENIFGKNKKIRGLLTRTVAAYLSKSLVSYIENGYNINSNISISNITLLHCMFISLIYSFAELPNSFIKRKLGIKPGETANNVILKYIFMIIDCCDSSIPTYYSFLYFTNNTNIFYTTYYHMPILHFSINILQKNLKLRK
jgi:hypothetical protein